MIPKSERRQGQRRHFLAAQDNQCGICRGWLPGSSTRAHVDHDHATGLVRGVLCVRCNIKLRNYDEDFCRKKIRSYQGDTNPWVRLEAYWWCRALYYLQTIDKRVAWPFKEVFSLRLEMQQEMLVY